MRVKDKFTVKDIFYSVALLNYNYNYYILCSKKTINIILN